MYYHLDPGGGGGVGVQKNFDLGGGGSTELYFNLGLDIILIVRGRLGSKEHTFFAAQTGHFVNNVQLMALLRHVLFCTSIL